MMDFWWDLFKTISNIAALVLAGAFGWLMKKFKTINERLDDIEEQTKARADAMERQLIASDHAAATQIAVLQSYHQSNTHRLAAIEDTAKRVEGKLDQLIMNISDQNRRD